jgi:hypothetical protein
MAKEAKDKAAREMAEDEREVKAKEAELKAQYAKDKKAHEEAMTAQADAFKDAEKANIAAEKAQDAARKKLAARNIAKHKEIMQERKAAFDKKFRNVWNVGPTGVSYFSFSLPDK